MSRWKPRRHRPAISILNAVDDPDLFAPHFRDPSTWAAWRCFLAVLFGLPLTTDQLAIYQQCTGRTTPPTTPSTEAWLVIGRRGGKSFALALVAVFLACFRDWRPFLGPGERGTIMVVAVDRRQTREIMRYIKALLTSVPALRRLIEGETQESLDLSNGVTIETHVASFRSTRGYSIVAGLLDEMAFWPHEDSAEPDVEIINAIRPGMATVPGAMLLCASSPYAKRGALWEAHRRHYGKDADPILVWQAETRTMNPTVPQSVIDRAMEADPASAAAEYGATFRSDIESYVAREAIEACVSRGVYERPPMPGTSYAAFTDPSGGSADSMTLAISHREAGIAVLDAVREIRPPFSPESAVQEFAALLRSYRITITTGDRYAGEWPRERFRQAGVAYQLSAKSKSDIYRDALPLINSRRLDLLDHSRLLNQLAGLERRTARGGRDSIDHAPGAHDDIANACAGALLQAAAPPQGITMSSYGLVGAAIDHPVYHAAPDGLWRDGAGLLYRQTISGMVRVRLPGDARSSANDRNGCIAGKGIDSPTTQMLTMLQAAYGYDRRR
jgi:hypothetical protein